MSSDRMPVSVNLNAGSQLPEEQFDRSRGSGEEAPSPHNHQAWALGLGKGSVSGHYMGGGAGIVCLFSREIMGPRTEGLSVPGRTHLS